LLDSKVRPFGLEVLWVNEEIPLIKARLLEKDAPGQPRLPAL
jgi:hypothetical protein